MKRSEYIDKNKREKPKDKNPFEVEIDLKRIVENKVKYFAALNPTLDIYAEIFHGLVKRGFTREEAISILYYKGTNL